MPSEVPLSGDYGRLVVCLDAECLDYLEQLSRALDVQVTRIVSEAIAFHALMMHAWDRRGEVVVSTPRERPYQLVSTLGS